MTDTIARKYITVGTLEHYTETFTTNVLNQALNTYASAFGASLSINGNSLSLLNSTGNTLNTITLPSVSTVDWSSVTNKPSTFDPSSHTHAGSEITSAVTDATNAAHVRVTPTDQSGTSLYSYPIVFVAGNDPDTNYILRTASNKPNTSRSSLTVNPGPDVDAGTQGITTLAVGNALDKSVDDNRQGAFALFGTGERYVRFIMGSTNTTSRDITINSNLTGNRTYTLPDANGTLALTSSNITGNSANVTGTVAIENGGTGATTRLNALKALTNQNVGANATHFLTITNSWASGGYSTVENVKSVLGIPATGTIATTSSDITGSSASCTGNAATATTATNANNVKLTHTVDDTLYPLVFGSSFTINDSQQALRIGTPSTTASNCALRCKAYCAAANTQGEAFLIIGNNLAKTSANNARGGLTMFGTGNHYLYIRAGDVTAHRTVTLVGGTADVTLTLPSETGTLALTSDIVASHVTKNGTYYSVDEIEFPSGFMIKLIRLKNTSVLPPDATSGNAETLTYTTPFNTTGVRSYLAGLYSRSGAVVMISTGSTNSNMYGGYVAGSNHGSNSSAFFLVSSNTGLTIPKVSPIYLAIVTGFK